MPETDLSLLIAAARQAGETAQGFIGKDLGVVEKDGGEGPVTRADLAVNAVLEDTLRGARPEYGWLSEESPDDPARRKAPACFIIDPIDGTRSFIEGARTWAHSIAIVEAGRVTAAVVYLPMLDKLYAAREGGGARLNGTPLATSATAQTDNAEVLATKASLDSRHWPGGTPAVKRNHRPSLAYRTCLVAEGRYDAMLTFRPTWEWDIAAGALILAEAGARMTDRRGAPIRFNAATPQADGVLAANPALHGALLDRMI